MKESSLGANHPDIAQSVSAVAEALHQLGRNEEAIRLNNRAHDVFVRAYGTTSPLVVRAGVATKTALIWEAVTGIPLKV